MAPAYQCAQILISLANPFGFVQKLLDSKLKMLKGLGIPAANPVKGWAFFLTKKGV